MNISDNETDQETVVRQTRRTALRVLFAMTIVHAIAASALILSSRPEAATALAPAEGECVAREASAKERKGDYYAGCLPRGMEFAAADKEPWNDQRAEWTQASIAYLDPEVVKVPRRGPRVRVETTVGPLSFGEYGSDLDAEPDRLGRTHKWTRFEGHEALLVRQPCGPILSGADSDGQPAISTPWCADEDSLLWAALHWWPSPALRVTVQANGLDIHTIFTIAGEVRR